MMSPTSTRSTRGAGPRFPRTIFAPPLVVSFALTCLIALSACTGGSSRAQQPQDRILEGEPEFKTISDLVKASDAIIVGTVMNTNPGRVLAGLQYRAVSLQVDEVLHGTVSESSVVVEEIGWLLEPGQDPIPTNPTARDAPAKIGDQWLVALAFKADVSKELAQPTYGAYSAAGFFIVEGDHVVSASTIVDDQGREAASLTLDQLKDEIQKASLALS